MIATKKERESSLDLNILSPGKNLQVYQSPIWMPILGYKLYNHSLNGNFISSYSYGNTDIIRSIGWGAKYEEILM
jgi:hypothetical protein